MDSNNFFLTGFYGQFLFSSPGMKAGEEAHIGILSVVQLVRRRGLTVIQIQLIMESKTKIIFVH